ncbi:hypothetical protein [Pyxidicoccus sp. MSG2]|uniref:hypothetical protein n=1 Tax=Pyxidicoccus sp. MSG2 TaxID=2996790 RepID=UPI0022719028|nr:hypothetical protein [Pyxidicoccus sp. MSG2]MCY1023129.1 hypothetical protein [Pyxidicoccus sp. MSG2]
MSLGRATALLVAALFYACDSSTSLPAPDILSVTPNQVAVPREVPVELRSPVRVSLDAVIPVRVDYGEEQVRTDAARVWIGSEEAAVQWVEQDGTLTVGVPEVLDMGSYDVRVALSDGRESTRSSVLRLIPWDDGRQVTDAGTVDIPDGEDAGPLSELDGGSPEDGGTSLDAGVKVPDGPGPDDPILPGDITGFELDELGDQERGVPFLVTVHAMGPRAAHFQDSVELTVNKQNGGVSPLKLGPFDYGLCVQLVTVDAQGGNVKLTVTDAYGSQGTSNGFKVK